MTPQPVEDLRNHVETVQATYPDAQERQRALEVLKRDLTSILGTVETYLQDTRLALGEGDGNSNGSSGDGSTGPSEPSSESAANPG